MWGNLRHHNVLKYQQNKFSRWAVMMKKEGKAVV
jgi:hypothetical protein